MQLSIYLMMLFIKLLDQSNDKLYDFSKDTPTSLANIYLHFIQIKDFIDIGNN